MAKIGTPGGLHQRLLTLASSTLLLCCALSFGAPLSAAEATHAESLQQQRARFTDAREALQQGDDERFEQIASTLQEYPLYPYLRYWYLREHLQDQQGETVRAFLERHQDTPLTAPLRSAWLRELAASERWQEYLEFYRGSRSAELRCYAHRAELAQGKRSAAWSGAQQLWLVGASQHQACDPLFTAWEEAGGLNDALRWQRIELAMDHGNTGLAKFLAKTLPEQEQRWTSLWIRVHDNPQLIAEEALLQEDNEHSRTIALHGMQRLASSDPEAATELWPAISLRHSFTQQERHSVAHAIALSLALKGNVRALEWYAALPPESFNKSRRGWAVRAALRHQRWLAAATWIESMPPAERNSEMWSYWLARAYEGLGKQEQAQQLYRRVSAARSYYGFLAADRLGSDYNLYHEPLSIADERLTQLMSLPALVRAHELYQLSLTDEARHEWNYAVARMNREQRMAAGKLAADWQWHDRALLSLARANHFDDLHIRFPLAYNETIFSEAQKHAIDPAWVYAVARQESAMDPHARSPVGALGLMQLMPGTGRNVARQLATALDDLSELLQPETNIRFGSHYLNEVLARFDNNPVLATAAYNAGPHRVERWFPEQASLDADIWIDTMPFYETRGYVRRVMAYAVFYDQRLERPIRRLSERMPAVVKPDAISRCKECVTTSDEPG